MDYRIHYRIYSLGGLPFRKICKPVPVYGRNHYRTWHLWDFQNSTWSTSSYVLHCVDQDMFQPKPTNASFACFRKISDSHFSKMLIALEKQLLLSKFLFLDLYNRPRSKYACPKTPLAPISSAVSIALRKCDSAFLYANGAVLIKKPIFFKIIEKSVLPSPPASWA